MSELQPAFAGAVGDRFHAAMVLVPTPIEDDAGDPSVLRDHGDLLADLRRLLALLPLNDLEARDGRDRTPRVVVDELSVDVLVRPKHDQSRTLGGPRDLFSDAQMAPVALRLARAR